MPNQSAMRIIVPKFPGSCTPSNAKINSFCGVASVEGKKGNTARTC